MGEALKEGEKRGEGEKKEDKKLEPHIEGQRLLMPEQEGRGAPTRAQEHATSPETQGRVSRAIQFKDSLLLAEPAGHISTDLCNR